MGIKVAHLLLQLEGVCFWVAEQASMRTSQQVHVDYLSCTCPVCTLEGTQKQLPEIRGMVRIKGDGFVEGVSNAL